MENREEAFIYCKYCGAKLKHDIYGPYCPTNNCGWQYGLPLEELTSRQRKKYVRAINDGK